MCVPNYCTVMPRKKKIKISNYSPRFDNLSRLMRNSRHMNHPTKYGKNIIFTKNIPNEPIKTMIAIKKSENVSLRCKLRLNYENVKIFPWY